MKTLYISNNSNIWVDTENNTCDSLNSQREGISRIYISDEPMHVVYKSGEYSRELDVEKDDIIITFYSGDWKNRIVVAKSKDWVDNMRQWNNEEQKRKEEWAQQQTNKCCCEDCSESTK